MSAPPSGRRWLAAALLLAVLALPAGAAPSVPASDEEVVETLPRVPAWRREEQALQRRLASQPQDARLALALARAYLGQARELGDARFAGLAAGVLQRWPQAETAPVEVLVMQATIAQHLHDFERAAALLETALARAPGEAQAWLTLATVRRVGGRLAESDAACAGLARSGQPLHAAACAAENLALRGDTRVALARLAVLIDEAPPVLRGWLLATQAGVHELAGRPAEAEAAYRRALTLGPDTYAALALADLLLARGVAREAAALLAEAPRSDAVMLRLALAARAGGSADADALAVELDQRFAAEAARGDAVGVHLREQARHLLELRGDARAALALARRNLLRQREPADLLLFARAAAAAGDRGALHELAALMKTLGVSDERVRVLLG